ncbi:hypothetical protein SADUNF_Sadunf06G0034400 [Salix dunnii]|uniref:Uncharacterized protein n=1 Tax=Salix dunnii TaxID=1413687 RepID=A0A835MUR0_9ROSI|nr:hypothetical protein SADUNF_Sadunf06G0034400 [Salix dunnii]
MLGDLGASMFLDHTDFSLQTRRWCGHLAWWLLDFTIKAGQGSFSGAGNVFEAADERLDADFSKHEMDFTKHEHPIAKQRPKISQAIEVLKLEVPMTNLPFEMPPFIFGNSNT